LKAPSGMGQKAQPRSFDYAPPNSLCHRIKL
jgi:hypothetical protein